MKCCTKNTLLLLFCTLSGSIFGQASYFQQEVNYTIAVTLNDSSHTLDGEIHIQYINNAPEALPFIYMHLWANAYKDQNTAFAKQQVELGKLDFYFAPKEVYGQFYGLDFKSNQQSIQWALDEVHPDIAKLELVEPLASGDTLDLHTPFQLKIPEAFSRLGHINQSYQLTQWYPKPAVYDRDGWHAMPYLDMGEFYSEFGTYEVSITLPKNYVVAATGELQTASEIDFLNQKIADSKSIEQDQVRIDPNSSSTQKTIKYKARQVHDFAWFADKEFLVHKSEVVLTSGKAIDTWAFFPPNSAKLWKDATKFINRSVKFYSDAIGEYPYPQATAVQADLKAGDGMEYPMITVIAELESTAALDDLITHEVGHNWFYGILAFNERAHPWMDEGLNTYYEQRYMHTYYGGLHYDFLPDLLTKKSEMPFLELAYLYQARRNLDQAPETSSEDFSRVNYLLSTYQKPAQVLRHLEHYLGQAKFDQLMQDFYQKWKFKHPKSIDFRSHLETGSGKDLAWLFDGYLFSDQKLDYQLGAIQYADSITIEVENKGDINAPFSISGLKNGKVVHTQWYEGIEEKDKVNFPPGSYDGFVLDQERTLYDINRKNNFSKKARDPFRLQVVPGIENDKGNTLFWAPALAWNNYDKFSLGALFYNTLVPAKKLQFVAAPLYGFNSKDLIGFGAIDYHLYPGSNFFKAITIGAQIRSANYNYNARDQYFQQYSTFQFSIKADLNRNPAGNFHHFLKWRSFRLGTEQALRDGAEFLGTDWQHTTIHELTYAGENRRKLNPSSYQIALEQQSYTDAFEVNQNYLKLSLEWMPQFSYKADKLISFRFFGGFFLSNSRRNGGSIFPGAFNMITQGFYDYRYDGLYFARNEGHGILSQQIEIKDGGFKNTIGQGFSLGRTNNFLLALNTKIDFPANLPFNLPLKAFFDLGYFDNAMPTGMSDTFKDQFLWSGGFMLEWMDGLFGIYFPLVNSDNIQNRYIERGNFLTRISFSIDVAKLNPYYHINRLEF